MVSLIGMRTRVQTDCQQSYSCEEMLNGLVIGMSRVYFHLIFDYKGYDLREYGDFDRQTEAKKNEEGLQSLLMHLQQGLLLRVLNIIEIEK